MRLSIIILAVIVCGAAWAAGTRKPLRAPMIVRTRSGHTLRLPAAMRQALLRYDRSFTPCTDAHFLPALVAHYRYSSRQAPFAAVGDFNGDGRRDVALLGHTKTRTVTLVIFAGRRSVRIIELDRDLQIEVRPDSKGGNARERGHLVFLETARPGLYHSPFEPQALRLRHDAFIRNAYEKAATLVYYRRGRFLEYATED